jgi:FtsZ-binding cell division protein ZapB
MALAKEDRSEALRNEVEELREESAALSDRAKRIARQADDLSERIRHLEKALAKLG